MGHLVVRRRHRVGGNYSGWNMGGRGPPPGVKVWVSQSRPTQTLTRESSSPLRILGLWFVHIDIGTTPCVILWIFSAFFCPNLPSSAHQQLCKRSSATWSGLTSDGWFVHSCEVWFVRQCGIWFVHWFEVWFARWREPTFRPQTRARTKTSDMLCD